MGEILFVVFNLKEEQGTSFSSIVIADYFHFVTVLCLTSLLHYVPNTDVIFRKYVYTIQVASGHIESLYPGSAKEQTKKKVCTHQRWKHWSLHDVCSGHQEISPHMSIV